MRILFVSEDYPPNNWNGSGTATFHAAHALAGRGHEVHVLRCIAGARPTDHRDGEVTVHIRRTIRLRGLSRLRGFLRRVPPAYEATQAIKRACQGPHYGRDAILRRLLMAASSYLAARRLMVDFDVIEAPECGEGTMLAIFPFAPMVLHIHCPPMLPIRLERKSLGWRGVCADFIDRLGARRATLLRCPSTLLVRTLQNAGWLGSRIPLVVPHPYVLDTRAEPGCPSVESTPPVVLFAGRLEWTKAPETLIAAVACLRGEIEGLVVVIAGSSAGTRDGEPYGEWIRRQAQERGVPCRFVGHVSQEEMSQYYRSARVVAIPSRFDAFPMVALEAMASGRPVVCTSRVGLADLIEREGAGAVVPPDDPEALAGALRSYLEDPSIAAITGARGRTLIETRLSADTIAAEIEVVFEEAIRLWRKPSEAALRSRSAVR